jgi:bacterioferritin-associated ferredoxin
MGIGVYVCVCKGVTDGEIRSAVGFGVRTLGELTTALGVASCCGRCADCAHRVVKEALLAGGLAPAGGDD